MRFSLPVMGGLTTGLAVAAVTIGIGSATAAPDYTVLLINPNDVVDTTAYIAGAPVWNPNGQSGVKTTYTHRDGSRSVTETVSVWPNNAAATSATNGNQAAAANRIANQTSQPVTVGAGGTLISGNSPDGANSVSVLVFTEGNTASQIEFTGPANDPAPADVMIDLANRQDGAIKANLGV
jgi:hypothetical protein